MTDYTPTTEEVRNEWRWNGEEYGSATDAARAAEFDRWLAGLIRQAKRDGWNEAAQLDAGCHDCIALGGYTNPYADE